MFVIEERWFFEEYKYKNIMDEELAFIIKYLMGLSDGEDGPGLELYDENENGIWSAP